MCYAIRKNSLYPFARMFNPLFGALAVCAAYVCICVSVLTNRIFLQAHIQKLRCQYIECFAIGWTRYPDSTKEKNWIHLNTRTVDNMVRNYV